MNICQISAESTRMYVILCFALFSGLEIFYNKLFFKWKIHAPWSSSWRLKSAGSGNDHRWKRLRGVWNLHCTSCQRMNLGTLAKSCYKLASLVFVNLGGWLVSWDVFFFLFGRSWFYSLKTRCNLSSQDISLPMQIWYVRILVLFHDHLNFMFSS